MKSKTKQSPAAKSAMPEKENKGSSSEATPSASEWWACLLGIVALNLWTRFHKISEPAWVCWDETHFGKMGSW